MTDRNNERDDEWERTEEAERRELEAAGWEPRGRGAKTIWRSPVAWRVVRSLPGRKDAEGKRTLTRGGASGTRWAGARPSN